MKRKIALEIAKIEMLQDGLVGRLGLRALIEAGVSFSYFQKWFEEYISK